MEHYGYALLTGFLSAYCAYRQKRSAFFWFFIGYFFNIWALAALALLPWLRKRMRVTQTNQDRSNSVHTLEVVPSFSLQIPPEAEKTLWYFLDQERQTIGPMSFRAFYDTWKKGKILTTTLVWNETFTEWKPFHEAFPAAFQGSKTPS